jgi:hypothetical protein
MQALVRVQARVRARRVRKSKDGLAVQRRLELRRLREAQQREAEVCFLSFEPIPVIKDSAICILNSRCGILVVAVKPAEVWEILF